MRHPVYGLYYIKGGSELLDNMNLDSFEKGGVSFVGAWLQTFQNFGQSTRISVIAQLYEALEPYEKDFIVGGLSGEGFDQF